MIAAPRALLRREIIRRGLYTPCCASCGELRLPRGPASLCSSLPVAFPIDAVIVSEGPPDPDASARSAAGLRKHFPWLRRIFPAGDGGVPSSPCLLHTAPELGEQYLVVQAGYTPGHAMPPGDFFTPNGIPYLLLENDPDKTAPDALRVAQGIFAQTRENAAAFPAEGGAPQDPAEYFSLAGRWAVAAGKAIPLSRQP